MREEGSRRDALRERAFLIRFDSFVGERGQAVFFSYIASDQ